MSGAASVAVMPRARARARSLGGLTQAYEGAVPSKGGRGVVLQSTCHMMKCMHGAWQGYASFVVLIGMRRKTALKSVSSDDYQNHKTGTPPPSIVHAVQHGECGLHH